ncbi:cAMP-activated global transcriptional regulator CRP [Methyloligella halotolerans]|uniref:cAMP-activated global transcriptional regulator CRP n=1 Tax=Methyloligella halotolerans TaxID=1177755 RepID=A0A1E2RX61_9HYPH|nr:Crp/Fnr family transcriptional regulator [Methyloligella halotolerans]ODA66720.1 cAMP-activated global transcriptional regulator CRP [Methyloligella halotolerans]
MNSLNDHSALKHPVTRLTEALTILEQRGWFAGRGADKQKRFASIARLKHYDAGEAVYLMGDVPTGIFGLVTGSLDCSFPRSDGEDYVMHRAGAGFWVGDLALLSEKPRLISIYAAEPTTLVQLPIQELSNLVREDPSLYADFYQLTYENFEHTFRIVTNLSMQSAKKRVADKLLFELNAWPQDEGWLVISQPDLARMTAISLPTLQRVIRRFAEDGLIVKAYGRIKVADPDGLLAICQQDGA